MIGGLRQLGMIAAVSLRLLSLIFQQVLGLVLLMSRTSSTRDVELLILRHELAVLRRTHQTTPGLGRPRRAGRPESASCPKRCEASPGHSGHRPVLAPPPRAQEWIYPKRSGRPPIDELLAGLVVQMAKKET